MGLMDAFAPEATMEIKQSDCLNLMKEAVKAEFLLNGIEARVPAEYMEAMATGKKIEREVEENAKNAYRNDQRPSRTHGTERRTRCGNKRKQRRH